MYDASKKGESKVSEFIFGGAAGAGLLFYLIYVLWKAEEF